MDTCSSNISFLKSWALIWSWSSFAVVIVYTLLGRLSTRCWNITTGTCFHSATKAFERSGADVGTSGLARSQCSNSSLCRPVKFFYTDIDKPFLYAPLFVHGGIVMLKQERAFPKLLPQSWKLYAVALRFPFTGSKGPSMAVYSILYTCQQQVWLK